MGKTSMDFEAGLRHQELKRHDKRLQRARLRQENRENLGPLLEFTQGLGVNCHYGYVLRIFQDGSVLVRIEESSRGKEEKAYVLIREGIAWEKYWPSLFHCYRLGIPTPIPFTPLRRIPKSVLELTTQFDSHSLLKVIQKLRLEGWLPPLSPIKPDAFEPFLTGLDPSVREALRRASSNK